MSEKSKPSGQQPSRGPIQTNDRQLPPVNNTLPMPKVVTPKKD